MTTTTRTLGLALATGTTLALSGCDFSEDTTPGSQDMQDMSKVMCQTFVERQLKAPDTADFGLLSEADVSYAAGDEVYTVIDHVDAENSFGANLRSNYTCKVMFMGEEEWQLIDLTGLDGE